MQILVDKLNYLIRTDLSKLTEDIAINNPTGYLLKDDKSGIVEPITIISLHLKLHTLPSYFVEISNKHQTSINNLSSIIEDKLNQALAQNKCTQTTIDGIQWYIKAANSLEDISFIINYLNSIVEFTPTTQLILTNSGRAKLKQDSGLFSTASYLTRPLLGLEEISQNSEQSYIESLITKKATEILLARGIQISEEEIANEQLLYPHKSYYDARDDIAERKREELEPTLKVEATKWLIQNELLITTPAIIDPALKKANMIIRAIQATLTSKATKAYQETTENLLKTDNLVIATRKKAQKQHDIPTFLSEEFNKLNKRSVQLIEDFKQEDDQMTISYPLRVALAAEYLEFVYTNYKTQTVSQIADTTNNIVQDLTQRMSLLQNSLLISEPAAEKKFFTKDADGTLQLDNGKYQHFIGVLSAQVIHKITTETDNIINVINIGLAGGEQLTDLIAQERAKIQTKNDANLSNNRFPTYYTLQLQLFDQFLIKFIHNQARNGNIGQLNLADNNLKTLLASKVEANLRIQFSDITESYAHTESFTLIKSLCDLVDGVVNDQFFTNRPMYLLEHLIPLGEKTLNIYNNIDLLKENKVATATAAPFIIANNISFNTAVIGSSVLTMYISAVLAILYSGVSLLGSLALSLFSLPIVGIIAALGGTIIGYEKVNPGTIDKLKQYFTSTSFIHNLSTRIANFGIGAGSSSAYVTSRLNFSVINAALVLSLPLAIIGYPIPLILAVATAGTLKTLPQFNLLKNLAANVAQLFAAFTNILKNNFDLTPFILKIANNKHTPELFTLYIQKFVLFLWINLDRSLSQQQALKIFIQNAVNKGILPSELIATESTQNSAISAARNASTLIFKSIYEFTKSPELSKLVGDVIQGRKYINKNILEQQQTIQNLHLTQSRLKALKLQPSLTAQEKTELQDYNIKIQELNKTINDYRKHLKTDLTNITHDVSNNLKNLITSFISKDNSIYVTNVILNFINATHNQMTAEQLKSLSRINFSYNEIHNLTAQGMDILNRIATSFFANFNNRIDNKLIDELIESSQQILKVYTTPSPYEGQIGKIAAIRKAIYQYAEIANSAIALINKALDIAVDIINDNKFKQELTSFISNLASYTMNNTSLLDKIMPITIPNPGQAIIPTQSQPETIQAASSNSTWHSNLEQINNFADVRVKNFQVRAIDFIAQKRNAYSTRRFYVKMFVLPLLSIARLSVKHAIPAKMDIRTTTISKDTLGNLQPSKIFKIVNPLKSFLKGISNLTRLAADSQKQSLPKFLLVTLPFRSMLFGAYCLKTLGQLMLLPILNYGLLLEAVKILLNIFNNNYTHRLLYFRPIEIFFKRWYKKDLNNLRDLVEQKSKEADKNNSYVNLGEILTKSAYQKNMLTNGIFKSFLYSLDFDSKLASEMKTMHNLDFYGITIDLKTLADLAGKQHFEITHCNFVGAQVNLNAVPSNNIDSVVNTIVQKIKDPIEQQQFRDVIAKAISFKTDMSR
ncbi:hypothetical protein [Rickettsiales endosymbiont of Stachyamoeba lipophora]|uniref:hypothetical protein n=1 Tax=Rickettsiales endosymbiont of Stachyamoeba lipophora TaxID=2486578 RepID=UPI000F64D9A8|nr:hypothetical protein [Rickettsiales endosymbiont of Stachyamoeba lipophora]AZL16399.1 hypothetical protein EF513_07675 [Rickettsiales endosymbiont of Stachyamoeba lipophora]